MAEQFTVKNFENVMKEYDNVLMESNRKNIMLAAALTEAQEEIRFLTNELEKLKEDQSLPVPADAGTQNKNKK